MSSYSAYFFKKFYNAFRGAYHLGATLGWASAMSDEAARILVHGASARDRNRFTKKVLRTDQKEQNAK